MKTILFIEKISICNEEYNECFITTKAFSITVKIIYHSHYNTLKFKHNSSIFYMSHLAFVNSNSDII
jgi:hypothetical protein